MSSRRPRTRVYIDGFNFCYAAFRPARFQQYKWLDLVAFCRAALPRNDTWLMRYSAALRGRTVGSAVSRIPLLVVA